MARRNKNKLFFTYECSMTGKKFKTTKKAPNPEGLLSVGAYYEYHPDEDDRPEVEKKKAQLKIEEEQAAQELPDLLR